MKRVMRKLLTPMAAVIAALALAAPAAAESLWNDRNSLFSDRKASGVGDVLMVRVIERFSDSDEGKTSSTKETDDEVQTGTGILSFLQAFGLGTSSSMSGNTKVERTKKVNMQVSCIVTDVMPNGNLVIAGDRSMVNGAERMNVRYSGVVRQQDISHGNVVDSTRVANAELICNGRGIITRTQRPGIINQILQAIF